MYVEKGHRYVAVRVHRPDIVLVNERTGKQGKRIGQGMVMVTDIDSGEQWFISTEEYDRSGWRCADPDYDRYLRHGPPPAAGSVGPQT